LPMTAKKREIDYARWAKQGFWLGAVLFVLGGVGEVVGRVLYGRIPSWENLLLLDMIGLGIVIAFVSVFVIGIALPLTGVLE